MIASQNEIKIDNTIIFNVDEYRDNHIVDFDGKVQNVSENGVDVIYVSGYKSRNDFISWKDIIAKLDMRRPYVKLKKSSFSRHFLEFGDE